MFTFNGKTHFATYSGIIVAYNYRERPLTLAKSKTIFKVNMDTVAIKLTFVCHFTEKSVDQCRRV
jgi:hypothetical protein